MVGMVTEYEESAATGHNARLVFGDGFQDFLFILEYFVGSQHIGFFAHPRLIVCIVLVAGCQGALEFSPPTMAATLEFLNLFGIEMIHFLQGLDECLVIKRNTQSL